MEALMQDFPLTLPHIFWRIEKPFAPKQKWPSIDEKAPMAMCYTSGTTGQPKGVVYSHRSQFLHAMGATQSASLGLLESDVILPIVPMFHANAWGLPYAAAMVGATFA